MKLYTDIKKKCSHLEKELVHAERISLTEIKIIIIETSLKLNERIKINKISNCLT